MSGFSAGFIKGALVSALGAGLVSALVPLEPADPGNKTQVELSTPAGSGFNAGRDDSEPVLPKTDQTVVSGSVQQPGSEPTIDESGQSAPIADTSSGTQPAASVDISMPSVSAGDDDVALLQTTQDITPAIPPAALGVPMPKIDNPVADIPVNRLPVIEPVVTEITAPQPTVVAEDTRPVLPNDDRAVESSALLRNRVAFDNPGDKPIMSIILVDAGAESLDRSALVTITFPVTFAVGLDSDNGARIAANYAENGFEIMALAPSGVQKLEAGETAGDLQALLGSMLTTMPKAIGLVDETGAELQQTAKLADQVIETLLASGHGLVTYDIGLNATDQKARRAGVKSGVVFRVLDANGENASVIKRYLNRAALEAGKDGHVILLAHTYPNTITALFSWALSPKSSTVVLAPLSAALLAR